VTRAIGDANFKPFVTARPEIVSGVVQADDAFICLASDGLWGDVDNGEVGKMIVERGVDKGAAFVIDEAFARGSEDNITVIVINLQQAAQKILTDSNRRSQRLEAEAAKTSILSHARALSQRLSVVSVSSPKHEVEDVHVPFTFPGVRVFSNDLVLWRDPLGSLLWFALGNLFGYATVVKGYPVIPQICIALLFRMITSFMTFRISNLLNRWGIYSSTEEDAKKFVARYQVVSAETITNFTGAIIATLLEILRRWEDIVLLGSTTRVLFALRTVTYIYSPVAVDLLAWIIFFLVFSFPAIYSRNKAPMDEFAKKVSDRIKIYNLKVEHRIKPHVLQLKERIALAKLKLGIPVSSPNFARLQNRKSAQPLQANGEKRRSVPRPLSPHHHPRTSVPRGLDPVMSESF